MVDCDFSISRYFYGIVKIVDTTGVAYKLIILYQANQFKL